MADRRAVPRRRRGRAAALAGAVALGGLVLSAPLVAAAPPPSQQVSPGDDVQVPVNPEADADEARREADHILRQDRFQAPGRDRNALQRLRDWIGDRLPDLPDLGGRGPGAGGQRLVGLVTIFVIVGLVAAAVTWVVRNGRRGRRGEEDEDIDADVAVEPLRTPREWTAEAERCEAAGDHRGAVRARFRATTTQLADRDLVADAPGRTAGELRADAADRAPEAAATFALLADLFEATWFGHAPAGPDESATARRLSDQVRGQAPRRPRAQADQPDDAEVGS